VHDLLVVHGDGNGFALDDDVLGEPLVVPDRRLIENVLHVVPAAGLDRVVCVLSPES
jgi:hypothetical protein